VKLRVGTRRSPLARTQTDHVCGLLRRAIPGLECEILPIETTGDAVRDRPLREVGGKGLFVKELDEALTDGSIDCAVHSLKDVPSIVPDGVILACVPERVAPHDVLISRLSAPLGSFEAGTRVGTTSLRRAGQLLAQNPGIEVGMLRGNIETRLARVREGRFDATLLAAAGLGRLSIHVDDLTMIALDPWAFVPAPAQGALAITCRQDDRTVRAACATINNECAECETTAERAVARALGGSCDLPLGALARMDGEALRLVAVVAAADGKKVLRHEREGTPDRAEELGGLVAELLAADGAHALLASKPV
jgi:hydroxymethylbilane synthase